MDRRDAIGRITAVLGGTLSGPTLAGLLAGCRAGVGSRSYQPRSMDAAQYRLVGIIAEHIIPTTDTPGAMAAEVDAFVDMMLTDFFSSAERTHFIAQLDDLAVKSRDLFGVRFEDASPADQVALLSELDADAYAVEGDSEPAAFMRTMKELTVSGYYTSEIGQTVELRTMPFGEYQADVPFDRVGRAWA